jgi:transcriptional adapter 3
MFLDQDAVKLSTNEPRGGIDQMNDDVAESDEVSTGPITARWLALSRPITRTAQEEANGLSSEMDIDGEQGSSDPKVDAMPPATSFPESTWKNVPHTQTPDYGSQESRLLEELRHIGFLSATDVPNFAEQQDDEVTARLRYLQRELNRVSLINGARKTRIAEIAEGRMAAQEWQGISDDLDTQLNQAYLKRNRNIGKGKKQIKRPGTAAPVGIARAGGAAVGEPIRSLMERRSQWNDLIGPVVDHGQVSVPKETIFDKENMDRLVKIEQENWIDNSDDL